MVRTKVENLLNPFSHIIMYLKLHDWGVLNLLSVSANAEFERNTNNVNVFHSKWYFIVFMQCPYEFDFSISSPDDVIYILLVVQRRL